MTLIGLVRVTGDVRDVDRQHELLDRICARVFEEEASRRRLIKNRPSARSLVLSVLEVRRGSSAWLLRE